MPASDDLYQIADQLRALATLGLSYASNSYDQDRYARILGLSAQLVGLVEQRAPDEILAQFQDNLSHVSPLAGVEAAVFRNDELLLIQRTDDQLWAIPGGLAEVGETLAEAAQRELWEETGLRGRITGLLGIFDSRLWKTRSKVQLYQVIFQADAGKDLPIVTNESLAVGFFSEERLPPLSPGHHLRVPLLFQQCRGEVATPYCDGFEPVNGKIAR